MEYRSVPQVRLPVSRLILGTASDGFNGGKDQSALLDAALSAGINTIDTAREYGQSERVIGQWLGKHRDEVVLVTKCAHPSPFRPMRLTEKEIREDVETSLRELNTDRIDILLLHRDHPSVEPGTVIEVMNALKAEGKIDAFGASNWSYERLRTAQEYAEKHRLIPFSVSSPHYSLARQQADPYGGGCVSLTGDENGAARRWYAETQMPVFSYSSLGRGMLSGKLKSGDAKNAAAVLDRFAIKGYCCEDNFRRLERCEELAEEKGCSVAQIAMAWLYCQPVNTFAIVTMSSPARMRENIAALSMKLSAKECRYLDLQEE
ncbi:MAG: aldo/keto reductase [Clostridia bacterium]|nr:aldo/keto reductase [Clostridia bacterium]